MSSPSTRRTCRRRRSTIRIWRSSRSCSIYRRAAPIRCATPAIVRRTLSARAAAIAALLNGADGVEGTADDFDAFLASGNNLAGTPAKAGYPEHRRPRRHVPERRHAAVPRRVQRERRAGRCHVLGTRVQRAAAHCARLCVRTGDASAQAAGQRPAAGQRYGDQALDKDGTKHGRHGQTRTARLDKDGTA